MDIFYEKPCIVCKLEGINKEAIQYCYTCDGLLCKRCVKYHRGCCTKTKDHEIGDLPRTPTPTPDPLPLPLTPTPPTPSPLPKIPSPARQTTPVAIAPRLIHVGELTFKANGKDCCVTGYDVLPNGKVVIADGKNKYIYIFSVENKLLCRLHVKWILDVAALSNNKLVFVYGEKVVSFVLIGARYRHMEVEKEAYTEFKCLRLRHHQEKIFVVCIDYAPFTSFIVVLNMKGVKVNKIMSPDFCMNFITINPASNEVFVTGIGGGIKVFDRDGNLMSTYRDVDIQWYYGIASDKYGNVFVCTQDEFGPEVYMLELETYGSGIKGLELQLTAKEGLLSPYRICYNSKEDLMLVGSNDFCDEEYQVKSFISTMTKSDNSLPVLVENKEPDEEVLELHVKHALMESSWGSSRLQLYKLEYSYADSTVW